MSCPGPARRAVPLAAALLSVAAPAADGPYCRRVRAEAEVQAALLMSPQLVLQGLHVPRGLAALPVSEADTSAFAPYQARIGVAFSPLNLARSVALTRASDDDCERDAAQTTLEAFIGSAEGAARLPALRRQLASLQANQPAWKALVEQEEARFAGRASTLLELNQVRARVAALERKLVQAEGEADRLAAAPSLPATRSTRDLVLRWLDHSRALERERSAVRTLSFWNVRLTAGAVASDQPLDWYGLAEVTVYTGALFQGHSERRALAAHEEQLRQERSSVEVRVREVERNLSLLRQQARRELALVEAQLAGVVATRTAIAHAETPDTAFALSLLSCDQFQGEAERAYLSSFIDQLSALIPKDDHE